MDPVDFMEAYFPDELLEGPCGDRGYKARMFILDLRCYIRNPYGIDKKRWESLVKKFSNTEIPFKFLTLVPQDYPESAGCVCVGELVKIVEYMPLKPRANLYYIPHDYTTL